MRPLKSMILTGCFFLSTFRGGLLSANAQGEAHGENFLGNFVEPLGILTFTCLSATLTLGLLMPRDRKKFFPWHRRLAYATLASALTHIFFIIASHF